MGSRLYQARAAAPDGRSTGGCRCGVVSRAIQLYYRPGPGRRRGPHIVSTPRKPLREVQVRSVTWKISPQPCRESRRGVFYSPYRLYKKAALAGAQPANQETRDRPKLWITKYQPSRMAWKTWKFRNGLSRWIPF